jgi:uncharacterized protein YecT (DUF1311 family)
VKLFRSRLIASTPPRALRARPSPSRGGWLAWIAPAAALVLAFVVALVAPPAEAQDRKPTAKEVAAIRACATKHKDDLDEVERQCLFNLVATPCTETPEGRSNVGQADCFRLETVIWDDLLNENFKALRETLDDDQAVKLRAMQRAWIAYRDTTCQFYYDKIQGTMAIPMQAACEARETARRAVLLAFFNRL